MQTTNSHAIDRRLCVLACDTIPSTDIQYESAGRRAADRLLITATRRRKSTTAGKSWAIAAQAGTSTAAE